MRTVYAIALNITDQSDATASINLIAQWIQEWYLRQRLSIDLLQSLDVGDLETTPADRHQFSIRHQGSARR